MKKPTAPPVNPNILAVLHKSGMVWRGIIASRSESEPSILHAREFSEDQLSEFSTWVDSYQVGDVLCVIPASSVICRNCSLPDVPTEQLSHALALQSEAHLSNIAPPHRTAMAVLPSAPGETTRTGIIVAWPESSDFEPPDLNRPIRFVPDIAAIAALHNGQRPTDPIFWLDRADGSVAISVAHANGVIFRATREDSSDRDNWQKNISRIVAETSLSVGHTGNFVESLSKHVRTKSATLNGSNAALFLPDEIIETSQGRLKGTSSDSSWWSTYGIAVGAVLARTGPLDSLTQLQHTPPTVAPSPISAIATKLSQPKVAVWMCVVCAVIVLIWPLVASGFRYGILNLKFRDIQQQHDASLVIKDQLTIYHELAKQNAWPMTKLLSDIVTNAPLGIELEWIRVEGGKDFAVSGIAIANAGRTPMEVVGLMQENIRADGLFSDIDISVGHSNNMGVYKFDMSGKVVQPFSIVEYPIDRDFRAMTYSTLLYGPDNLHSTTTDSDTSLTSAETLGTDTSSAYAMDSDTTRLASSTIDDPSMPDGAESESKRTGATSAMRQYRRPTASASSDLADPSSQSASSVAPHRDIPPPLTPDQIASATRAELRALLSRIADARRITRDDDELSERLKRDFDMVMDQMKRVKE